MQTADAPDIVLATPRSLPAARKLRGRVVVLDIAFASNAGGSSFEKITGKFIHELGSQLALWVDHHDSDQHQNYASDPRFVLHRKAEHGACPQLVTQALVANTTQMGPIGTLVCHSDFDGLMSAAKWLRAGVECYPGADADAFAIDTCTGVASPIAQTVHSAIVCMARNKLFLERIVYFLAGGASDPTTLAEIRAAGAAHAGLKASAERLAQHFLPAARDTVLVTVGPDWPPFDRTHALLLGQQIARVAAILDRESLTFAAHFNSGIDFLKLFGLTGGMPTVVSLHSDELPRALAALNAGLD